MFNDVEMLAYLLLFIQDEQEVFFVAFVHTTPCAVFQYNN